MKTTFCQNSNSNQRLPNFLVVIGLHSDFAEEIDYPIKILNQLFSAFSFSFYALNMDDNMKVKKALSMFVDLFGLERFEYDTLVRFFITVRKNYRHVAYHNWTHGFHVANSIYCILKSSPGIFKPLEVSLHLIFSWKTNFIFFLKICQSTRSKIFLSNPDQLY